MYKPMNFYTNVTNLCRRRVGKLLFVGHIQATVFVKNSEYTNKEKSAFYWYTETPFCFLFYILSVVAFALQQQSWVVLTDCMAWKARNIYCLALYRECFPSCELDQEVDYCHCHRGSFVSSHSHNTLPNHFSDF